MLRNQVFFFEDEMFQTKKWVESTKAANALFADGHYLQALTAYEDILALFKEFEDRVNLFLGKDQMQLLDMYIISCHNVSDCLAKIKLSSELIKYAYKPISVIGQLQKKIEVEALDELRSRFDHCYAFYAQSLQCSDPKFIASKLNSLTIDIMSH